jgi:hypothetical protein
MNIIELAKECGWEMPERTFATTLDNLEAFATAIAKQAVEEYKQQESLRKEATK